MKKRALATFLAAFLLMSNNTVLAIGGENITRTKEFTSSSKTSKGDFDKYIIKEGKKYKLRKVDAEVISETPGKKTITKNVDLGETFTKDKNAPETDTEDGLTVSLKDITYDDTTITGRTTSYSYAFEYDDVIEAPKPAPKREVSFVDTITGNNVTGILNFQRLITTKPFEWRADVNIPIIFKVYDASYYEVNGDRIPYDNDKPSIQGHEKTLLEMLKLPLKSYRIDDYNWDGDPYFEDGIECRKAILNCSRYIASFRTEYFGENIKLPDAEGYKATANYAVEIDDPTSTTYKIRATATYTPYHPILWTIFWCVLLALIALAIWWIIKKKKKPLPNKEEAK